MSENTHMTPSKLEEIRERAKKLDRDNANLPWEGVKFTDTRSDDDRRALLAYVDELLVRVAHVREVAWKRAVQVTLTRRSLRRLLAHQQARGIAAREEEERGVKDYLDLRDHADAQSVELATLRKQLEEREADMHQRIRDGYDRTVADSEQEQL